MSDFQVIYGEMKYKVDYFDPMYGTEFIGFFEGSWANMELEHYLCDRDFVYNSYKEDRTKPHYIVEAFYGMYFTSKVTKSIIRYYDTDPYETEDRGLAEDSEGNGHLEVRDGVEEL